ncbi:hypothetical protein [Agrobacterium tumefaciens]|uniref:hypothetical protein n=1 Tax=Agrobacterium tumefaciens TaxID=358 RepID=UPI001BA50751
MSLPTKLPTDFKPVTEDDMALALADPMWRLCNLYWITTKDDDADEALVVKFKPNRAQRRLLKGLWFRNIILKARQLGFTTLIAIYFLDCCLFRENVRAGIVAQDLGAAETIFRDKVRFAYGKLPPAIQEATPLLEENKSELRFANNSSIRVATSMRSGTLQYLHISEFGKICAKFPERAKEVVTGSIPAVAQNGIICIESTAEGQDGEFYAMTQAAMKLHQSKKKLTKKEYRFHFFPWWGAIEYRLEPDGVMITAKDHEYFDKIEVTMDCEIDIEQRAWYVATREADFPGAEERMWQEFPSTPDEAFQKSTEGCYYSRQMVAARKAGRITTVPYMPGYPVNTFWDIGHSDGTAIWLHQFVGQQHRFIKFIEGWAEPYAHYVTEMQATGWVWGTHYLPHDGNHVRQGQDVSLSPREMLLNLGLRNIEIVERVSELQHGIQATRNLFPQCWFDAEGCKEGLIHLEMYRKKFNSTTQTFTEEPLKDIHTEGADSFRQCAQGFKIHTVAAGTRPKRRNKSGRIT